MESLGVGGPKCDRGCPETSGGWMDTWVWEAVWRLKHLLALEMKEGSGGPRMEGMSS